MTPEELDARLAKHPEICQTWIVAKTIGDAGVLYLSGIHDAEERIGTVHACIWGRGAARRPDLVNAAARELMAEERLDRLMCEIDTRNRRAISLAVRVGMKPVGVLRARKNGRGSANDVLLMDALPGDLKWER